MAGPAVPTPDVERPSGSFVSVRHDGFEIQSNTGTEADMRADLGLDDEATPAQEPAPPEKPPRSQSRHENPKARTASLQAEIDAQVERRRIAKAEADAEEARLTKLREDAQGLTRQPAAPARPPVAPHPPAPATTAGPEYDGLDPKDPEPKFEDFANHPSGDPYTAYMREVNRWDIRREWRKQNFQQAQGAQRQQAQAVYAEREARIKKSFSTVDADTRQRIDPDIATALTWGGLPEDPGTLLGNLIADQDNPVDFLVYLSEHKDDFQRISTLHPLLQGVAFGEIKARLAAAHSPAPAPKPKPVSQAKPTIKAVAATPQGSAPDDDRPDEDLSDDEHDARFAKYRRQFR